MLKPRHFRPLLAVWLLSLFSTACGPPQEPPVEVTVPEGTPRLVLFIVVDQHRADYLERFRPLLTGGIARLLDESVQFTDTQHDHFITNTGPGHATLATGDYPAHHGVISNGWYDREAGEVVAAVYDEEYRRSPRALERPTLGDRLKEAYPTAKVFTVGGKDRSAFFTAGKKADAGFYYGQSDGELKTSRYYLEELPAWVKEFNDSGFVDKFYGQAWEPLLPLEKVAPFDIEPIDLGWRSSTFPHVLGSLDAYPGESFYEDVYTSPVLDEFVIEAAKRLIVAEDLGGDATPDFLGVLLSALDITGHTWGPDSPEMLDTLLRADRLLDGFLDFVDQRIGLENVIVSYSSDHGVAPVPELAAKRGEDAKRVDHEEILCFQGLGKDLDAKFGAERWFEVGGYLDRQRVADENVDRAAFDQEVKSYLEACPRVARVFSRSALEEEPKDEIERRFQHSAHSERSPDFATLFAPNTVSSSALTNHGTPYRYDAQVPWMLRLPRVAAKSIDEPVFTVDVAPTIGSYLGLDLEGKVDGTSRRGWIDTR